MCIHIVASRKVEIEGIIFKAIEAKKKKRNKDQFKNKTMKL